MGMNRFPGKRREKAFFPCLSLLHSGRRFQFGVAEMGAVFFLYGLRTVLSRFLHGYASRYRKPNLIADGFAMTLSELRARGRVAGYMYAKTREMANNRTR